ncbi:MAG: hypothetical protein GC160_14395 [Acidobacteria bacterium]|nr:hypothetical protein [Acidobacteriota bacterium]
MLSFTTELPIQHGHGPDAFLEAIQAWILGSPHTKLTADKLALLGRQAEFQIQQGSDSINILRATCGDENTTGIRYLQQNGGLEWRTTAVFSQDASDTWVGVTVSCEASHPAVRLPPAKKPILVKTLLERLGGASDGELRVCDSPRRLAESEIDFASRLIAGRSACRLPIVYVSAGFQGSHILDPVRLARDLAGMAHVVVEPSRPFSVRLKTEVDSENVYGGTIGVYWPDGGGRRSFFVGREYDSPREVARAVFNEIQVALTNRRPLERCTWAHVQETASRQALRALRASGSQEVEKYIETFDRELAAKDQRIEDANREIVRLKNDIKVYQARLDAGAGSILRIGDEQDLFPNEVLAIVRSTIEDGRTRVPQDSRRQHVLDAVLRANPEPEDIAGSMQEKLKELLRGSKGIDARVRKGLEAMGFSISKDGKHYKLTFQDDDRYTFALPSSGSDHRGGLNAASDITRMLL